MWCCSPNYTHSLLTHSHTRALRIGVARGNSIVDTPKNPRLTGQNDTRRVLGLLTTSKMRSRSGLYSEHSRSSQRCPRPSNWGRGSLPLPRTPPPLSNFGPSGLKSAPPPDNFPATPYGPAESATRQVSFDAVFTCSRCDVMCAPLSVLLEKRAPDVCHSLHRLSVVNV